MTIKNKRVNENGDTEYDVTVMSAAEIKNPRRNENGDVECEVVFPLVMLLPILGGTDR